MASREAEEFWQLIRSLPRLLEMPLAEARAAGEFGEALTAEPPGMRYSPWRESGGFAVEPVDGTADVDILYFFGSAYGIGSPACRRRTAGHLARVASARVIVPTYRLAPEHRYPAAFEDGVNAYRAVAADGAGRALFLAGDSAPAAASRQPSASPPSAPV